MEKIMVVGAVASAAATAAGYFMTGCL